MNRHIIRMLQVSLFLTMSASMTGFSSGSFDDCPMASNQELDEMRGGFEASMNGVQLKMAFAMENVTFINDQLVAVTKLNVPDLASVNGTGAPVTFSTTAAAAASPVNGDIHPNLALPQISNLGQTVMVVQNGAGNRLSLPQNMNTIGTVIQNTMDNQVIRNMTTLNVTLANQGLFRAMQLNSMINQGIARSIR